MPEGPMQGDANPTTRPGPTMTIPWAMVPTRSALVELVVRGRVARDVGDVRIRLEAGDGTVVGEAAVDPTGHGHGLWFPFESRFEIPRAGPSRGAGLFVVVVDGDGTMLRSVRRPFTAGLLLDVTALRSRSAKAMVEPRPERSIGNDGLMGGIVFGVPMEERNGLGQAPAGVDRASNAPTGD